MGRVCADDPSAAQYRFVLDHSGLSAASPAEELKTCWFLGPAKGESMDCEVLRRAEAAVAAEWDRCENGNVPAYALLSHNCRYYVKEVMVAYCKEADPSGAKPPCSC
jgi:hypothetical protein